MTIDEAIEISRDRASEYRLKAADDKQNGNDVLADFYLLFAREQVQIADWLEELKKLKERQERYKWHDLRKNPKDLPKVGTCVVSIWDYGERSHYSVDKKITRQLIGCFANGINEEIKCVAWREIEPFEEGI